MACPKCKASMIVQGDRMVCSKACGYSYAIVKTMPRQEDLIIEVEALRKRNAELEFFVDEFIEGAGEKEDYVRWAVKLRDGGQVLTG